MLSRKKLFILFFILITPLFSPSTYANNAANINKLFDLAESEYPQYFSPSPAVTQTFEQWTYRYYSNSDIYAGVNTEGQVFVVGGYFGDTLVHVGQLDTLLNQECSQRMGPYATQTQPGKDGEKLIAKGIV